MVYLFCLQEKPTEAKKAKKDENGTAPDAEDAGDEEADDEEIEGEDEEYGDEGGKHTRSEWVFALKMFGVCSFFVVYTLNHHLLMAFFRFCFATDIPYGEEDDLEGEDDEDDLEGG